MNSFSFWVPGCLPYFTCSTGTIPLLMYVGGVVLLRNFPFVGARFGGSTYRINALSGQLELELIQTQMAQKPMLRTEVGMRVRCANKASAE
jgi:hypothetical protein